MILSVENDNLHHLLAKRRKTAKLYLYTVLIIGNLQHEFTIFKPYKRSDGNETVREKNH